MTSSKLVYNIWQRNVYISMEMMEMKKSWLKMRLLPGPLRCAESSSLLELLASSVPRLLCSTMHHLNFIARIHSKSIKHSLQLSIDSESSTIQAHLAESCWALAGSFTTKKVSRDLDILMQKCYCSVHALACSNEALRLVMRKSSLVPRPIFL